MTNTSPKVLIYSHDSFGLGHLRRCRTIAHALTERFGDLSVLILSGSPIIGSFEFRTRVDFTVPKSLKTKTKAARYVPNPEAHWGPKARAKGSAKGNTHGGGGGAKAQAAAKRLAEQKARGAAKKKARAEARAKAKAEVAGNGSAGSADADADSNITEPPTKRPREDADPGK